MQPISERLVQVCNKKEEEEKKMEIHFHFNLKYFNNIYYYLDW